jgi:hypothetical protein
MVNVQEALLQPLTVEQGITASPVPVKLGLKNVKAVTRINVTVMLLARRPTPSRFAAPDSSP